MILVTGATGTIGKDVVKELVAKGEKVRSRDVEKAKKALPAGVEVAKGDLSDPASIAAALKGADKLFLLVSASPQMVQLQSNAIQAAKRAGVKLIVKLSAVGAKKGSPVSIGDWHGQTEEELKASDVPYTILQPGPFAQNLLMQAAPIKAQGAFYGAAGQGRSPFIDARDIAAVAAAVLTTPGHAGKTYVLTGPKASTYEEAAQALSAAAGKPVKYVDMPPAQMEESMAKNGLPAWLAKDLAAMQGFYRAGTGAQVTQTVEQILGKPGRTIDQFARDFAAAFR